MVVGEIGEVMESEYGLLSWVEDCEDFMSDEVGSWVFEEETAKGFLSIGGASIVFVCSLWIEYFVVSWMSYCCSKDGRVSRRSNLYIRPSIRKVVIRNPENEPHLMLAAAQAVESLESTCNELVLSELRLGPRTVAWDVI